jgi:hypothetical protein
MIGLLISACKGPAPVKELTPYRSLHSRGPLEIDGTLNEAGWDRAEKLPIHLVYHPKDSTAPIPGGTVQLLWDDQFLYVGFTCKDDDIWSYSKIPDEDLWLGDVVEIFIKPHRDQHAYYEFVIAPNAVLYDARYASRGAGSTHRFRTWSSGAVVASHTDGTDGDWQDNDRGYTVEIAIPWSAFSAGDRPPAGETWTFAAFRYDYSKSTEAPYLLMSVPVSTIGFHDYEAYQELIFVD